MKRDAASTVIPTHGLKAEALASMSVSFERFCLAAGLETLSEMLEQDATAACGERHERGERRQAHRWGRTKGGIGFHGGKVEIERPRLRGLDGAERVLPSLWFGAGSERRSASQAPDWLCFGGVSLRCVFTIGISRFSLTVDYIDATTALFEKAGGTLLEGPYDLIAQEARPGKWPRRPAPWGPRIEFERFVAPFAKTQRRDRSAGWRCASA